MKDIFSDLPLQREDILARIAEKLQLDNTRKARMESAYAALSQIIHEDQGFFKDLQIDIYAQGSVPIGTTVKPFRGDEFDLDIVIHIKSPYHLHTPAQIYDALLKKLENDGRYSHMVEKKRRCVRLNYEGDFHMDILPGCIIIITDEYNLKVPDRELLEWTNTNPKGYIEWFLNISNQVNEPVLEGYYKNLMQLRAEIQDLPEDNFYKKKPLQRGVQLIKRYRDIYFEKIPDFATSSIILTTLAAQFYKGENGIFNTINNILASILSETANKRNIGQRLKVLNPVNSQEDFSEKWDSEPELYKHFIAFVTDLYTKWQDLKNDFRLSASIYEKIFGESIYKGAIKEQIEKLGSVNTNPLIKAGSLIIGNNARTDRQGNINQTNGTLNEKHRDFGDR